MGKDPSEAAVELSSLKGCVHAGLNEDGIDERRQYLLWQALAFISKTVGASQTVNMLLNMVIDSKLLTQHLPRYLIGLRTSPANDKGRDRQESLLRNVITVFDNMLQSLPSHCSDIKLAVTLLSDATEKLTDMDYHEELVMSLKMLTRQIDAIEKEKDRRQQVERIYQNPPPDDFREQSVLPTVKELEAGYQPFLRPHLTRGVYADTDHYLDVQFRLLKEDFIYPLRNGISEYLAFKKAHPGKRAKLQDVKIYEDVRFVQSKRDFSGLSHFLSFKKMTGVRWQSSKRLMFGSLLILTTNDFKTYLFATVANRAVEELEKGLVAVALVDREDATCLYNKMFVMAESSVFFEAYRPVLTGLQRMEASSLPLSKYILSLSKEVDPPFYLTTESVQEDLEEDFSDPSTQLHPVRFDISSLLKHHEQSLPDIEGLPEFIADFTERVQRLPRINEILILFQRSEEFGRRLDSAERLALITNYKQGSGHVSRDIQILDDSAWPRINEVQLDESQLEAVKMALTKEISIIQGPPGTGKTYIGLKIMQILLKNQTVWMGNDPGPILLVCFTNHALDQFLEGILDFHQKGIIRVGSRSKSVRLQHLNLNRMLGPRRHEEEEWVGRRKRLVKKEVDTAKIRVERFQARMDGTKHAIFNEYELGWFMTWPQSNSLLRLYHMKPNISWLLEWLLCECQHDDDWNQEHVGQNVTAPERVNQEEDNAQDEENTEEPTPDPQSIEVEEERNIIESERMIDETTAYEAPNEGETVDIQEDYVFLALDVNEMKGQQHRRMKQFIQRKLLGKDKIDENIIPNITDVWRMRPNDRWALYHYWVRNYTTYLQAQLAEHEQKFKELCSQLEEANDVEKFHVLRTAAVIGMTTTGAAKHQHVLQRVKPKILIVEEAAEVLEAHIITSLNASCQQLILIGDHQQLRPKPNVYMLAKKYHLDVSLFERLFNNDFPCTQLELQHRMRPELSAIMRRHFYDNLQDHDVVKQYDHIQGVEKDIFFLDHNEPENSMEDTQSHFNLYEVRFIVALCYYLLQQGYNSSQITILTAYTGQLLHFKQMMDRTKFDGVRVASVDNFQGEENDIILLSFVRSNSEGRIGFLGIANRVCVALSRAKKGLYCAGNFTLLAGKSDMWKRIVRDLESNEFIGKSLPLQCVNHPDQRTLVKTSDDFKTVPEGGCSKACEARLDCGHVCRLICHPTDQDHQLYKCKAPCKNVICPRGHLCPKTCCEQCPERCEVIIEKILSCGHACNANCWKDVSSIKCNKDVPKTLSCSHVRILPCYKSTDGLESECQVDVERLLPCGHHKQEKCCERGRCEEEVSKMLPCGHNCWTKCFQDPQKIQCEDIVKKTLPCGHKHTVPCHTDITKIKCEMMTIKFLDCGHLLREECYKETDCQKLVPKELGCGHEKTMECSVEADTVECKESCTELLSCGHKCRGICGKPCIQECSEMVKRSDWSCGHKVTVECSATPKACYIKCDASLLCGHPCTGTCGECYQGRFHVPCKETCGKTLLCGHSCELKCGVPCYVCSKKCFRRCVHGRCKLPCKQPCDLCMKRCNWKCDHHECTNLCCEPCNRPPCDKPCPRKRKCGHPCIGLCGEICPKMCRICDKTELEQRFFGDEDPSTSR